MLRLGKTPRPADAVDLLIECHERIRTFLALARRIAAADVVDHESLRDAAAAGYRYFTQALPLHALDEETSLIPRLRGREAALDRELDEMAREHGDHERPLRALVEALGAVAADPTRHRELAPRIAAATGELEQHFLVHLRREEEVIFPAMRRLLDRLADSQIVNEIRARRAPAVQRATSDAGEPI